MKGKRKLALLVVPLAAAIGGVGYQRGWFDPTAEGHAIRVSGNIEVTDAEVSFKIAGRVDRRLVSEGELVASGDLVAELDSSDLEAEGAIRRAELGVVEAALAELEAGSRPEEIAGAAAALEEAQAYLAELEAGSRPQEIAVAEAALARTRAELIDAETNYARLSRLHEEQVAADQEFDTARAVYGAAQARVQEAEEQLKLVREGPRKEQIARARAAVAQARERFKLVELGPRQEVIGQARARVEQAKAALALAETRLGYATLSAPLSGIVLSENVEPGEYVAPGTPVVTVGDLEHVWVRAYINETDLGRVKVGQQVRVTTDTYPDKSYEGRVSFIASEAEFTPKNVQTTKERIKLVYRIKVDIPNPDMELKPGMPADAEILLDQAAGNAP
ncbi:MAG: efflux RND transporter periplasmic adaptor subunit [Phycisphaerae bacterium]|nr:efflux RND transporter periplasmic adaptor subunit [Phycisphaerae bacterium]